MIAHMRMNYGSNRGDMMLEIVEERVVNERIEKIQKKIKRIQNILKDLTQDVRDINKPAERHLECVKCFKELDEFELWEHDDDGRVWCCQCRSEVLGEYISP